MKKFVSMTDINSVFLKVEAVDYITVKHVSDTSVDLVVYLKSGFSGKDEKLRDDLSSCSTQLGKLLARNVTYTVVSLPLFGRFITRLSNLLIK